MTLQLFIPFLEKKQKKKKRNNFPYAVKEIQKYLQSCKGIKTNFENILGNRLHLCNRKNEAISPMPGRQLKVSAKLYKKL